jgi:glycosyltransferase involved in cell wall biosynthesis
LKDSLKILYDFQIFDVQRVGGISRYFFGLMEHLKKSDTLSVELSLKRSNNQYLEDQSDHRFQEIIDQQKEFLFGIEFKGKYRVYNLFNKLIKRTSSIFQQENIEEGIKTIKAAQFDILHPTYFDAYFMDYIGNKPYVLTVHDLIEEKYPEFQLFYEESTGEELYRDNKRKVLFKASRLIAISEETKKDLISYYGIEESKIDVVHLGTDFGSYPSVEPQEFKVLGNTYLLYVGDRRKYKNFYFAINAIKQELIDRNLKVLCVGGAFSYAESKFFKRIGIEDYIIFSQANDNELAFYYRNAKALLFPSLAEGFGIPMIEALSCSCPVLASNTAINKEVLGECAIFFDQKDQKDLRRQLKLIFNDITAVEKIVHEGNKRVKQFTLAKMADSTFEVYKKVKSGL